MIDKTFKTLCATAIKLLIQKFDILSEKVVIQIQSSTPEKLDKLTEEIFEVENEKMRERLLVRSHSLMGVAFLLKNKTYS